MFLYAASWLLLVPDHHQLDLVRLISGSNVFSRIGDRIRVARVCIYIHIEIAHCNRLANKGCRRKARAAGIAPKSGNATELISALFSPNGANNQKYK